MKEKVFNGLKQAYAPLGLGDTFLSGLADMIVATTQVTDENLQGIIAGQKAFLETMQKTNDKRVQEAIGKATRESEDNAKKLKEEHEKAIADKMKQIAELEAKLSSPTPPVEPPKPPKADDVPEWYKREKAEREKREQEWKQQLQSLSEAKAATEAEMQKIKDEKSRQDKERAAAERTKHISEKALEKGIPQWMVNHGFADIPQDADDKKIDEILSGYAQEIQANFLPAKGATPQFDGKTATKAETDAIVAKLFPDAQRNEQKK